MHTSYTELYERSIRDPEGFWLEQSQTLDWFTPPKTALSYRWDENHIEHAWFPDGKINVTVNCLDRHVAAQPNKTAIIWQGENDNETRLLTYKELHAEVCKFANVLLSQGIKKGDRICLYMPMIPELAIATLACARIGAIHSIVFAGFSAESLIHRINDCSCSLVITANEGLRGGKHLPLKQTIDAAVAQTPSVKKIIVVKRTETPCQMQPGRDVWYYEAMQSADSTHVPAIMDACDPLFILYTSGSTGKPKGVLHGQAGYLLYAAFTHKLVFDIQDDDIYWCTADLGWITGHSYCIYGPLANGTTTLLFEGIPTYPDPGRFWQIIDKFKVSIFYTAPTAIRALIRLGDEHPAKYNLSSLRILGSVGEPINPDVWMWYYEKIGRNRCPIVDTWWQTETGGIMISPLPGSHKLKPGSASRPFFGVAPLIVHDDGTPCAYGESGALCITKPWPGIMQTTWGNHDLFVKTYFSRFKGMYFSGDGAHVDADGDVWLEGRIDDVVNVSGHRIGTAEVESALVSHPTVAEAAVVPIPHEIKGQGLYAFVILREGVSETDDLKNELSKNVRTLIGPIAQPEAIQFAEALPKTRSGKIMRRILRRIASNDIADLGDTSTLADPSVIDSLLRSR